LVILVGILTLVTGSVSASSHGICDAENQITLDQDPDLNDIKEDYCDKVDDVQDSKSAVENDLESFEKNQDNPNEVNQSLAQLKTDQQEMMELEGELIQAVVKATSDGSIKGGFSVINTIQQGANEEYNEIETVINAGNQAIETEYTSVKNTLRATLFGSLTGGVLLGVILGAAVPVVAAKKAENKMRLSSDISFDKKIAIIPSIIGVVLIIVGLAIMTTQLGLENLFEVLI